MRFSLSRQALTTTVSAICLGAMANTASAQDLDLGEIVVTPNRTPTELSKTGSSVTVIDQEQIEEQSQPLVTDYLSRVPGVAISSTGGPGAEGSFAIRGAPKRYVKTLYNGIDISDPTNTQVQTSYQYLLSGGLDSIEVLKGSQSTLYGSEAIAGVVSFSTLGEVEPGVTHLLSGEGGSFGTARGSYGLRASNGDSRLSFNATGYRTDGISAAAAGTERDGYENITLDIAAEHAFSDMFSVFGSGLYIDGEAEFDDNFSTPPADDPTLLNKNTTRQLGGRIGLKLDFLDGRLKNRFAVQTFDLDRTIDLVSQFGPYSSTFAGKRTKAEYQGEWLATDKLKLTYGAELEQQKAQFEDNLASPVFDGKATTFGAWTLADLQVTESLNVSAGLRHDEHELFGGATTYRLATNLAVSEDLRIHASYGTGFRAPSLYELYGPATYSGGTPVGNPTLQPETSKSFDLGFTWSPDRSDTSIDVTYFHTSITDLIVCDPIGPFGCAYNQVPGTSRSHGVEASLAYAVNSQLTLGGAYTYTKSEDADGNRLPRVPRHTIALSADYEPTEKWSLSATGLAAIDTVDSGNVELDDYFLLNAKVAYKPTEDTELYLRGENLLDQDYQTARGYGTPGISVFAGFIAKFGQ